MIKSKRIYISEVKKKIKISSKYKREFLETLNSNLDIYLEGNPNATYEDIENDFGKAVPVYSVEEVTEFIE